MGRRGRHIIRMLSHVLDMICLENIYHIYYVLFLTLKPKLGCCNNKLKYSIVYLPSLEDKLENCRKYPTYSRVK